MSLLSYSQLVSRVVEGKVITERSGEKIPERLVNASSVDIRLGRKVLIEDKSSKLYIDYRARQSLDMTEYDMDAGDGYVLLPGEFILTESEEVFHLPLDLSFEYKLKSSMARVGLEHLTAGWADAGWHGSVLTLELKNMNRFHRILIRPGDTIGQVTFFSHEPVPADKSYAARGRYNNDLSVTQTKVKQ